MIDLDGNEIGGSALLVGYLVILVVLYRDPASGVAAATAGPGAVVLFLALPVAGVVAGVYSLLDGPYGGISLFVLGSYLGILALGVTVPALLASAGGVLLGAGALALALSVVALVASGTWVVAAVGSPPSGEPPD